ncbi:MAG TPA: Fe-S-containing hydro-lyase [Syntrophales bacterium]|jgi:fumarate hydratase subunit beta|nr:Fe-S-containing hydro-lyase [Syntrophales bacterium]HQA83274.1 Fe-S-containing hydro-lyase [Syntrophales bacterium]
MDPMTALHTPLTDEICESLRSGDRVLLSGKIYTARDAAHQRILDAIEAGNPLPFPPTGEIIFYAGPTPAKPGMPIGSIGPTTSGRMDRFAPKLLELGLKGMIGKGKRAPEVREAICRFKGVYFGAVGGIAALMAKCVRNAEWVAYEDLGPEGIMRLDVVDLPLVVINDSHGGDLYEKAICRYRQRGSVP